MNSHSLAEPGLATIALSAIDLEDRTFRITTEGETEPLGESIMQLGLLNPPRLIVKSHRWRIVSGFRRISACAVLGKPQIQAWCLAPNTGEANCALMAIADNGLQRPLSLVEQIRASQLLLAHFETETDLDAMAARVGLPPNPKLLRQLAALAAAPPALFHAMAAGAISLPVALDLMGRPAPDRAELVTIFSELRPSLNRQRELMGFLDDIALRDGQAVAQVLAEALVAARDGYESDDAGKGRDRSFQLNQLRAALRKRRYPHLVQAEALRDQKMKALKLGPAMQLVPPANFEGRRFELKLGFSSLAELRDRCDSCQLLLDNPALADLLT
jgi:hypothetical protein